MWYSFFLGEFYLGCSKCTQDYNSVLDCIQFILTSHTHTHRTHTAFHRQFQIQLPTAKWAGEDQGKLNGHLKGATDTPCQTTVARREQWA